MEDYVKIEKIGEGMYLKFRHFMYPKPRFTKVFQSLDVFINLLRNGNLF